MRKIKRRLSAHWTKKEPHSEEMIDPINESFKVSGAELIKEGDENLTNIKVEVKRSYGMSSFVLLSAEWSSITWLKTTSCNEKFVTKHTLEMLMKNSKVALFMAHKDVMNKQ